MRRRCPELLPAVLMALHVACAPAERGGPKPVGGAPRPEPAPGATASEPATPAAAGSTKPEPPRSAEPKPCGDLGCLAFDSPEAAFDFVLGRAPRVLAIGEAHAQRGSEGIPSATRRFAEQLLPRLAGRATDLVIELWVAAGHCGKVEREVAKRQEPVTQNQRADNQSEFMALGHRAKALGIAPHALVPTCDEYQEIAGAGAGDIDRMLQMIADGTTRTVSELLERRGPGATIVAYGGALHNDVAPRPGRERWSFGPTLSEKTGGAYVELDLIVPEFVKDTEVWRAFPWYSAFRAAENVTGTLLYSPAPNAFVLIFPRSAPAPATSESRSQHFETAVPPQ